MCVFVCLFAACILNWHSIMHGMHHSQSCPISVKQHAGIKADRAVHISTLLRVLTHLPTDHCSGQLPRCPGWSRKLALGTRIQNIKMRPAQAFLRSLSLAVLLQSAHVVAQGTAVPTILQEVNVTIQGWQGLHDMSMVVANFGQIPFGSMLRCAGHVCSLQLASGIRY